MVELTKDTYNLQNVFNRAISNIAKEIVKINEALENGGGGGGGTVDLSGYAKKSGLYKDATTPVDLETQCQSLETRVGNSATNDALASATDSSTNLMVLDPSTSAQGTLDSALANIYVAPAKMSEQDMNTMTTKVAKEIVTNPDYLRIIVKSVTDIITKTTE